MGTPPKIKRELNQGQGKGKKGEEIPGKGSRVLHSVLQRGAFPAGMVPSLSPPHRGSTAPALVCDFRNMLLILGILFPTVLRHLSPPWLEAAEPGSAFQILMDDPANAPAWLLQRNSSLIPAGSCSGCMESKDQRWEGLTLSHTLCQTSWKWEFHHYSHKTL